MAKRADKLAVMGLALACMMPAWAADVPDDGLTVPARPASRNGLPARVFDVAAAKSSRLIEEAAQPRPTDSQLREPSLAQAIGRAGRQGVVERSVEAYSEVLIQCQKNRSPILTVPFQRADSQQAHCYRF